VEHNHAIYLERLQIGKSALQSLGLASLITTTIFLIELIGGLLSGSLALLADSGHMATDVLALGLGWLAVWFAKKPATPERTYGYYRVEILAALANGVILCALSILVCYEAVLRLNQPKKHSCRGNVWFWCSWLAGKCGIGFTAAQNQSHQCQCAGGIFTRDWRLAWFSGSGRRCSSHLLYGMALLRCYH
jgi:Co/Zn/Cd efflux system component